MHIRDKLVHTFDDPTLLTQALTHRSHGAHNYERLEYLGDSLLGFFIAQSLYRRFPEAGEGALTRLRARLVRKSTLADIARELDLGDDLLMGAGERKSGGFLRDSALSDALEAIIGAMYLDGGYDVCVRQLGVWFEARIERLDAIGEKDAKTRLQERLQADGRPLPVYETLRIEGEPHDQEFTVSCAVSELDAAEVASGSSRRAAEQAAAARVLDVLTREED